MHLPQKLLVCLVAGGMLSLTACNDNNKSSNNTPTKPAEPTTREVTVTPSLGQILKGRVVLKNALTKQNIVDIKNIGSNGKVTFSVDISKLGQPIIAEVLPTADGKFEYADEAIPTKAVSLEIAAADINKAILRAAASVSSSANSDIGVTALTEAALQQAEKTAGGLTATAINSANAAVKSQLKLNFDITQPPVVVGLGEFGKLVDQNSNAVQRTYATYLATLAKEAKRLNSSSKQPAYDILKAFADDFSDGTFDAKKGSAALAYYNSSFINAWINWVSNFYSQFLGFTTLAAFNSWFAGFNAETPTPPVTTETCASKKLPVTTLSSISAYAGDYKDQGVLVFNLNTTTATATVKGTQIGTIKEVCGPTNLANGTNHVLITDKGNVTLFKTTAGVYSAEGQEFTDKTKVFYGEKAAVVTPTLCESSGADDKLGFKNAPNDFCSFSKASSVAITSPDIYTFFNSDKKQNVKVTVESNVVKSVAIEDNNYAWACGIGSLAACNGVTFKNNTSSKEFIFSNTVLSTVFGTTQTLTLKNGSLIHLQNTTPTTPVITSTNGPFTLNKAACKPLSVDSAAAQYLYNQCTGAVIDDFSLTMKTLQNKNCTFKKTGNVVEVSSEGQTITETFNADTEDLLGINNPSGPFATFGDVVTAKTYGVREINISIYPDGKFKSVIATNTSPAFQIACLP